MLLRSNDASKEKEATTKNTSFEDLAFSQSNRSEIFRKRVFQLSDKILKLQEKWCGDHPSLFRIDEAAEKASRLKSIMGNQEDAKALIAEQFRIAKDHLPRSKHLGVELLKTLAYARIGATSEASTTLEILEGRIKQSRTALERSYVFEMEAKIYAYLNDEKRAFGSLKHLGRCDRSTPLFAVAGFFAVAVELPLIFLSIGEQEKAKAILRNIVEEAHKKHLRDYSWCHMRRLIDYGTLQLRLGDKSFGLRTLASVRNVEREKHEPEGSDTFWGHDLAVAASYALGGRTTKARMLFREMYSRDPEDIHVGDRRRDVMTAYVAVGDWDKVLKLRNRSQISPSSIIVFDAMYDLGRAGKSFTAKRLIRCLLTGITDENRNATSVRAFGHLTEGLLDGGHLEAAKRALTTIKNLKLHRRLDLSPFTVRVAIQEGNIGDAIRELAFVQRALKNGKSDPQGKPWAKLYLDLGDAILAEESRKRRVLPYSDLP